MIADKPEYQQKQAEVSNLGHQAGALQGSVRNQAMGSGSGLAGGALGGTLGNPDEWLRKECLQWSIQSLRAVDHYEPAIIVKRAQEFFRFVKDGTTPGGSA